MNVLPSGGALPPMGGDSTPIKPVAASGDLALERPNNSSEEAASALIAAAAGFTSPASSPVAESLHTELGVPMLVCPLPV